MDETALTPLLSFDTTPYKYHERPKNDASSDANANAFRSMKHTSLRYDPSSHSATTATTTPTTNDAIESTADDPLGFLSASATALGTCPQANFVASRQARFDSARRAACPSGSKRLMHASTCLSRVEVRKTPSWRHWALSRSRKTRFPGFARGDARHRLPPAQRNRQRRAPVVEDARRAEQAVAAKHVPAFQADGLVQRVQTHAARGLVP